MTKRMTQLVQFSKTFSPLVKKRLLNAITLPSSTVISNLKKTWKHRDPQGIQIFNLHGHLIS